METISGKAIWNEATKAGLMFGLVSVAYNYISIYLGSLVGSSFLLNFFASVGVWLLRVAKIVGLILLMRACMTRLTRNYSEVTNGDTFLLGIAISALSAIIVAGFTLLDCTVLLPTHYQDLMNQVMAELQPSMDANLRSAMEDVLSNFSGIMFWSTLFYCILYGVILSRILSRRIPAQDPFADFPHSDNPDQQ
ncbi:MAG: DUF4199 domain-containing protein [Bacteroidales bacterium]|jgi:hypothetical protein|nr:DUF4199 domain-containing protein [Bacteroidales bacterium]MBR1501941.1 DUF4199 domain-containing protein [Bacteroidales bacterium]MBR1636853.1 DUF4199 domain-containing protein [Bacteroidales bacterium]MBR1893900.1 DUF4199 domain-containing protein [Bacteroidales bacterium]